MRAGSDDGPAKTKSNNQRSAIGILRGAMDRLSTDGQSDPVICGRATRQVSVCPNFVLSAETTDSNGRERGQI